MFWSAALQPPRLIPHNHEITSPMDLVTHGLASFAVARAFFPRSTKQASVYAVFGGIIADVDWLSRFAGPSAFLRWHATYTHSILGAILLSAIIPAALLAGLFWGGFGFELPKGTPLPQDSSAVRKLRLQTFQSALPVALAAPLCAALLHIAMDACQSEGVALFWPFSAKRIALDWLPSLDPWILIILIGAVALPELLHLVSSEIGAKAKKPRGQTGAAIGLLLLVVYVGVRATLHSNVLAMMQSRTFHGETPRRAAAFPETLSLLTWHGIVETERALDETTVDLAASGSFDSDSGLRVFKPEPSPALDAAGKTSAAARFLAVARFPKATVEKTETGFVVQLRDLRYTASGDTQHELAALIQLDLNGKVTSQELVWARDLPR